MPNYPRTVAEVLDPTMKFRPDVLRALRAFKRSKPWRGTPKERMAKFDDIHGELSRIYGKEIVLVFDHIDDSPSDGSSYCRATGTITLRGRLSVVTYLHEWAHALGKNEREACRWSINLFRRVFPRLFERCRQDGHLLRRPEAPEQAQPNEGDSVDTPSDGGCRASTDAAGGDSVQAQNGTAEEGRFEHE